MTSVFIASLVLAAIALVLIVLLMWRARRVKVASTPGARTGRRRWVDLRDGLRRRYAVLERAVRYVLAHRDWRYRSSWVLLMGLPGDGKSSLAASIPDELLRHPRRKDARHASYLSRAVEYTQWHFLEQGVLIDPDRALGSPIGDAGVERRWHAMLSDIDSLRPDRALDGLVWVISAARLLGTDDAELQALAAHAFARINDVQERFAFALPVYVVVSQCDAVQGFDAFWDAQDIALRHEMTGWSSPTINDNGLPSEWVDKAFDKLIEGLSSLVLASAASHDHIDDVDGFFLFPQYMRGLQPPLRRFLEVVFKPNVYETRAFCRGIYFTGAAKDDVPGGPGPRNDIAFVEGLLHDKVFAEQRLAQRTQKGLLARNRLIRRLQIGTLAAGLLLVAALPWTANQLSARTMALRDTVVNVSVNSKTLGRRGCLDQQHVYALIDQVASLDTQTRYLAIPLSWVDRRIDHGITDVTSTNALRMVVLPSMACRLQQRIDALSRTTLKTMNTQLVPDVAVAGEELQLKQQLADLAALEDNLVRFAYIAEPSVYSEHKELLQDFATLAEYVYGKPLPESATRGNSALSDALVAATYGNAPHITPALRERLADQFDRMAVQARADLMSQVGRGVPLLSALRNDKPPVLKQLRNFNGWLNWVRSAWLLSTPGDNPCSRMGEAISSGIEELIRNHHYEASLRNVLNEFNTVQCYQPAVDSLRHATLPPYGALLVVNPESQVLQAVNPGLESEAGGLKALANASFMQVKAPRPFSCNGAVGGWRAGAFHEVLAELREYQLFAGRQKLYSVGLLKGGEPLYDRLARAQLQLALADSLARNQRQHADQAGSIGLDAVSQLDRELSTESTDLSGSLVPLLQSLQQLRQIHLDTLADSVSQCARNYASGMLLDVSGLATASQLYDPAVQPDDDDAAAIFDLGAPPVLQSYLDRQIARVQVLAGYAAPFVTLLKNSRGVSDSRRLNVQSDVYWDNTINELNRAIQFADPAGQAARLSDFFLKQLDPMSYANCAGLLNAYQPPASGNDLFSARRAAMLKVAQLACSDHGQSGLDMHFYRIAMLFNSELAGRYPFGPANSHEVSLATVKAFFVYYAKEKPELETRLSSAKGSKAAQMKAFISRLDAVQAFFAGNLSATPQSTPIALDVGFRAMPDESPQSNQLIAWTLSAGSDKAVWPAPTTQLPWAFGEPLALDLQWADRSRFTPVPDPAQSDLGVTGRHAVFQASGPWALLHLLDAHRPVPAATSALDPAEQLLEFQVPVLPTSPDPGGSDSAKNSHLYLTLRLSANDPATKAAVPLTVPSFPREAPVLW